MSLSRLESSLLRAHRGPFLSPGDGDGGGGGAGNGDGNANANHADSGGQQGDGKGGEGFKPITSEAELSAYKADLRKNIAAELRKSIADDLKAEQDRKAEDDRKKRDADDLKAKGQFEQVETTLRTDLKTAQDEATVLKAENDQLRAAMKTGVEAQWKDLPAALQIAGKFLAEDDVLGRWTYLNDADVQKQIKDAQKGDPATGNGRNPKGGANDGKPDVSKITEELRALRGLR
jgi:hypothetical protein